MRIGSPTDAIRLGIGYVPEDRRQHGVILELGIAKNISLANLGSVSRGGLIDAGRETELAEHYVSSLRIKAASLFAAAGTLSGGNQQKVALARWLAIHPTILILDEPTQGVDVGAKLDIYNLIRQISGQGIGILMVSSELAELAGLCDRILILRQGELTDIVPAAGITETRLLALCYGEPDENS